MGIYTYKHTAQEGQYKRLHTAGGVYLTAGEGCHMQVSIKSVVVALHTNQPLYALRTNQPLYVQIECVFLERPRHLLNQITRIAI